MLFRAFLPDGWMPTPAAARTIDAAWPAFVICTSHGLAAPDPVQPGGDQRHRYTPCAYAAASHLAPPAAAAVVALYETAFVSAPLSAGVGILFDRTSFQPQRSRAPPFLSI